MATPSEAVSILNALAVKLRERQTDVETYNDAYAGNQRLTFASDDFRTYFGTRYSKFSDNWCGIVADAPHERLEVTGIRLKDAEDGDKELWESWRQNDADALSDLAFLDAIIAKRSYALVWGNEDDEAKITWEHPSQCVVGYDPETRERTAGLKLWADDENEFATLYLKSEIWKFQRSRSKLELPDYVTDWRPREGVKPVMDNPLGRVPLVEIPNRPRLMGEPTSDIAGTLAMQHAINLFWAQLFASSDEATLGQRVILGGEMPTVPVLNDDGAEVGTRPIDLKEFSRKRALWLENPDTKIAQWQAAKLDVFTDVIEIMVGHIAAQTRTPSHYLMIGGSIANVSGDAMKALETGLVMRTKEKTQHFGRAVRDVFELVALAQGDTGKAKAVRGGEVLWKDVENRSDAQRADSLQKKHAMGYPLRYILELDGLPPTEVTRIMNMVEEEGLGAVVSRLTRPADGPSPLTAPADAPFGD
jgi:hypothetical protein